MTPTALDGIVLACRQSPDWAALATDHRAGRPIDPRRFVPDHAIPGFPPNIEAIIAAWNARFSIDFFTCRAIIANLSRASAASVRNAAQFAHDDASAITEHARRQNFVLFFHDDDDLFAPDIFDRLSAGQDWQADTCVFPLFRVENDLFTFVRGREPVEFIWGRRQDFHFRFQSNNYGINSRICTAEILRRMKDHVLASNFATEAGFTEAVLPYFISATIKAPSAASLASTALTDPALHLRQMHDFAERFSNPDLPEKYNWLKTPLSQIAKLFNAIARGQTF
jgi:hypothetical protein